MNAVVQAKPSAELLERVLLGGDLSKLSSNDRLTYYAKVCESVGLNPLTRPFDYLTLNGKLVLYAKRDATDQLRKVHGVSVTITARETIEGVYVVTARAKDKDGREDESTGAVAIENLKGDARANALMKAETKAKRRVTLSICGLGMLDESEIETIPTEARVSERTIEHESLVPSGKHRGKPWGDVADDYLLWAVDAEKAPEALRSGAEAELERRARVAEAQQAEVDAQDDSRIP